MENEFEYSSEVGEFRQRVETYVGNDKADEVKDVYRFILNKIGAGKPRAILDVGCATGDLLAALKEAYPRSRLTGLDKEIQLLEVARKRTVLDDVQLIQGDALTEKLGKFDLVTCLGVMGIFDQFEPLLENLLANTVSGGRVFVQALLNPDDIDVRVIYRDKKNGLDWMRGFNIFSRKQVATWAVKQGVEVLFHDFYMNSQLQKRPELPHRAYTIDLADGTRRTTNGLCLLLPETVMEMRV